jgi:succinate dehydrogenase hydrophobic anchor subunit
MDTTTSARPGHGAAAVSHGGDVAHQVDDAVRERPWVQQVTRLGWLAKGVVYLLFGVTAWSIARQESTANEASPQGALDAVRDRSGGRVLLAVLAVGLVLYVVWRVLSVVLRRGNDARAWLDRIGYAFSAVFYALLALTAGRSALRGSETGGSNTIEDMSTSVLETTGGRWLLGAAGIVIIAVGLYFIIKKGLERGFLDDVQLGKAGKTEQRVVTISGVVGHVGRGIVIALVGFFVTRAAVRFDASDAKGFDRALRDVADTDTGSWIVLAGAAGLFVYGVFCIVSARHQVLRRS